jgi:asparagine synthase (glutamine-hydrolysing)
VSDRYVILIAQGDARVPDSWRGILQDEGLILAFHAARAYVFAGADTPLLHLPERGLIIGTLFDRRTAASFDTAGETAFGPPSDDPRWLIDHAWGRYVALLCSSDNETAHVVRDPAGLVSCYHATRAPWFAFASDARLLQRLGLVRGQIDWTAVGHTLRFPDLRTAATCLDDVTEPLPGAALRFGDDGPSQAMLWSPDRFCRRQALRDFPEAADAVRSEVDRCVGAWSRRFDPLLLSLSGGLDSSIIAASVPDASSRLQGLTLISGQGRGDESGYAATLAATIGFPLTQARVDQPDADLRRSLAADRPRPSARAFTQAIDHVMALQADRFGAGAHLNGGGGDSVFAFLHSANPAADRLAVEGLGRGFCSTLLDLAEITHCSAWQIANRALRKTWGHRARFSWPTTTSLLPRESIASLPQPPAHPWVDGLEDLLPGQREHAVSILRAMSFCDYLNIADRRPTLYPLLSQPLVELCLTIPSWYCCKGGDNRAVARAAFADRIPDTILRRRTKGAFDGRIAALFEANRRLLREICLDGGLARNRLIDRAALEAVLDQPIITGGHYARILQFADVEAWAASWP